MRKVKRKMENKWVAIPRAKIKEIAKSFVNIWSNMYDLDYSIESVKNLDTLIENIKREFKDPEDQNRLLIGGYLTEVILRNFKAKVKTSPENYPDYLELPDLRDEDRGVTILVIIIEICRRITVFPLSKVERRFDSGMENSLYAYIKTLEEMVKKSK